MMRAAGAGADGARLRALIVILWRAGLRIGEALALAETDLDASRGAVLVRRGKGGRRREVGMDRWAWSQLQPWTSVRRQLPVGALLCVIRGATAGRHWEPSSARKQLASTAVKAGVRRRFAPHQLRHAHPVEMAHEGVPLVVIQRQLGHANLGITSIYLQGIDSSEIIHAVHSRPAPVIPATAALDRCSEPHTGRVGDRPPARFPRIPEGDRGIPLVPVGIRKQGCSRIRSLEAGTMTLESRIGVTSVSGAPSQSRAACSLSHARRRLCRHGCHRSRAWTTSGT